MLKPSADYKLNTVEKKIENAQVENIYNNTFL